MPRIYFSTLNSSYYNQGIKKILNEMIAKKINNIEISSGHKYEKNFLEELKKFKERGGNILLHNYSPPTSGDLLINLSDPDEYKRKRSIELIVERICITKALGGDYYSFHGGFCVFNFQIGKSNSEKRTIAKEQARKYYLNSLKEIVKYAEKNNVKIGFENNAVEKGNEKFLITWAADEIKEIFKTIRSKKLFLHLDVGHLNITANTYGFDKINFIKRFQNQIYALHLHQNNGLKDKHLAVDENLWIWPYIKIFKNLKYVILETKGPLTVDYIKKTKQLIVVK